MLILGLIVRKEKHGLTFWLCKSIWPNGQNSSQEELCCRSSQNFPFLPDPSSLKIRRSAAVPPTLKYAGARALAIDSTAREWKSKLFQRSAIAFESMATCKHIALWKGIKQYWNSKNNLHSKTSRRWRKWPCPCRHERRFRSSPPPQRRPEWRRWARSIFLRSWLSFLTKD